MELQLREITEANRAAVEALRVTARQEDFVAGVVDSIAEAASTPEANPWYRAVYDGDRPVGFVMLSWNVTPQPGIRGPWFLWRLLVDVDSQGQGYGTAIVDRVVDLIRAEGATELLTSCNPAADGPLPFYRRLGFHPTGEYDDGEIVLSRPIPPSG
jgi:diamine N-acetyltransferase